MANSWLNLPLDCRHSGYITKLTRKKTLGLVGPLFCECPPPLGFTPTRNFPRSHAARRFRSLNSSDCFFFFFPFTSSARFHLRCLVSRSRPLFLFLFVCLFVSISLFSSSFCLGFAFPERDYGNWYVVSLGLFLCFITPEEMEISRWYPYCQRYTRLQFCFPRGFVRFFVLVKAGCVTFWTDARANSCFFFFFFLCILLKRRGEIGSCMN